MKQENKKSRNQESKKAINQESKLIFCLGRPLRRASEARRPYDFLIRPQGRMFYCFIAFLTFPLAVFANGGGHASGEEHNGVPQLNDVAVINPLYAVAVVVGAAVIGFLVWRLLLKK